MGSTTSGSGSSSNKRAALFGPVAALAAVVVTLAACGSSGGGGSGSGGTNSAPASSSTVVGLAPGADGDYLTDSAGRAVYLWDADTSTTSTCSGPCAAAWPPLTTHARPRAEAGVNATLLGTSKRDDGSMQVTYAGHPLYLYAGDSGSGTTSGQGIDSFGAEWWLVAPSGKAITSGTASSPSTGSIGGGGSGYGY